MTVKFVVPKTVAAAADMLYAIREERLDMEYQVSLLAKKEAQVKEFLINHLPKQEATGVRGHTAQVTIERKDVPTAENWALVWKYVKSHNATDLLQHRLNDKAVRARWEHGVKIPGVKKFTTVTVHCTKLGGGK